MANNFQFSIAVHILAGLACGCDKEGVTSGHLAQSVNTRASFLRRTPANPSSWIFGLNGAGRATCSRLALNEVVEEQTGVKIAKAIADENPALAARYGIQSIPTMLYFGDGELKGKSVGVTGKRQVLSRLEKLVVPTKTIN